MTGTRIWHVGGEACPDGVNGVNAVVWAFAREQSQRGNDVTLVTLGGERSEVDGIHTLPLSQALRSAAVPDVCHMHSVLIPHQGALALHLRRRHVPYVITPHNGTHPLDLAHSRIRKTVYSALVERRRFRGAQVITALSNEEKRHIQQFVGRGCPRVEVLPNPVATDTLPETELDPSVEEIIFLGRFSAYQKGFDRLAAWAEKLPEIRFGLYGDGESPPMPSNVTVHAPVYGIQKARVLRSALAYVQMSRWEGFPMSVVEAMLVGTPPILASEIGFCEILTESQVGLVVPPLPDATGLARVRELVQRRRDCPGPDEAVRDAIRQLVNPKRVTDQLDAVYAEAARRAADRA